MFLELTVREERERERGERARERETDRQTDRQREAAKCLKDQPECVRGAAFPMQAHTVEINFS